MTPWLDDGDVQLYHGDAIAVLDQLPPASAQTCITSPPYWGLRDYGIDGQIGLEDSPAAYVARMADVFRSVRRVLRDDGTVWLNLGDTYNAYNGNRSAGRTTLEGRAQVGLPERPAGFGLADKALKSKDLVGIPWRVAFALQEDGWYLRSDIIWSKPNPMPESITDRPTKAHEYLFLLAKSQRYYYDAGAIREQAIPGSRSGNRERLVATAGQRQRTNSHLGFNVPWEDDGTGRNRRSVWEIATRPTPEAHFATFPEALVEPCVLAGSPAGGVVLDPFMGSGTTALVARKHGRRAVGVELNDEYLEIAARRLGQQSLLSPDAA